jgi:hypothetical protein
MVSLFTSIGGTSMFQENKLNINLINYPILNSLFSFIVALILFVFLNMNTVYAGTTTQETSGTLQNLEEMAQTLIDRVGDDQLPAIDQLIRKVQEADARIKIPKGCILIFLT